MENRLDIIIFGATGFTGKGTIPYLTKLIKSENLSLTWGAAGRKIEKLEEVLSEIGQKTGEDFSKIPKIAADIGDKESIENMTARAKVILNAVGPYRLYGEVVVQACVKSGTHHIDISGEPYYVDEILSKYHEAAKEKGIYLISTCGMDSIPADLGAVFLQKNFEGTLNSIDSYLYVTVEGGPYKGASLHYGTYESVVHELERLSMSEMKRQVCSETEEDFEPEFPSNHKKSMFKSDLLNKWATVFPSIDRSVMYRTQKYMQETYDSRPIQIQTYFAFNKMGQMLSMAATTPMLAVMSKSKFTRSLLLKHPKFFTHGLISHEGPTEEKQENTHFHVVLVGKGWNEKLPASVKFSREPDKTVIAKVSGKNPAYGFTSIAFSLCAIIVLTERDKMPQYGGTYSPGAAFENTSMIEKLNKYGVTFELDTTSSL